MKWSTYFDSVVVWQLAEEITGRPGLFFLCVEAGRFNIYWF